MSRRNACFLVVGIVLLAAGIVFVAVQIERRRQLKRDVARIASEQLNNSFANGLVSADMNGPRLDSSATLDGDVTTLTFTISNRKSHLYRDIRFEGFTLEKRVPRDESTLPVKIAELPPGASHVFTLHYDRLDWIRDDVSVDRIDLGWAQKPLDVSSSWVAVVDPTSLSSDPSVTVNSNESKGSNHTSGLPIHLNEQDARALKERRDALWKAKAKSPKLPATPSR